MGFEQIAAILSREIKNPSSCFVFPSETVSSEWARKALAFAGIRSVALNRFMAWDRFKETVLREEAPGRTPVSGTIRKLFAYALAAQNARAVRDAEGRDNPPGEAGPPPLRSLIPPEFAEGGAVFAPRIAACLPSLGLLKTRMEDPRYTPDEEDRDFAFIEGEYRRFLTQRGLFEPAWERPLLRDRTRDYYIFFPDAIEDFTEYAGVLEGEPTVRLVEARAQAPEGLLRYDSQRAEIRAAVLGLRRLYEEGIPYEDMAVSVPGLEDLEPYLLRELSLYNVPFRRRSGRPLAAYGTGRLFSLIQACVANNFSFSSLKSLLLNGQLPWKYPELNRELIAFGIRNNCVSGYYERGRPVDIWLEAFQGFDRDERLREYYKSLRDRLRSLAASRSFTDVRNRYFAFRGDWEKPGSAPDFSGFLSRDACSGEEDAVLARCIEELSGLIRLEQDYPDLIPASPFNFFLTVLAEKQYVPLRHESGVHIFPYRVAAAAPFACHFVLNAAQNAAAVLYQPLGFLGQAKREKLGAADRDVSAAFFRLYQGCPRSRISASEETFSGWAIPHSFFSASAGNAPPPPPDPFLRERFWWADPSGAAAEFPPGLFCIQKAGFDIWRNTLREAAGYNLLKKPFPGGDRYSLAVGEKILGRDGGLKISATEDLNVFFTCPALWLYRRIFSLSDFHSEAQLMDDKSLGSLYHKILEKLFSRIREEDDLFIPEHLDAYYRWIGEYTGDAIKQYPPFQGPLALPLLVSQAELIAKRLRRLLKTEAAYFPRYGIGELESPLALIKDGVRLTGILDRISISPGGGHVIVDYKTNAVPARTECTETGESPLRDFQIPMYIRLYEENSGHRVEEAFFVSIHKHAVTAVFGKQKKGEDTTLRKKYQPTMDAFEGYAEQFKNALCSLDFSPKEISYKNCLACGYKRICRTTFFLNAHSGLAGSPGAGEGPRGR
jgi:RecB family exonuclease